MLAEHGVILTELHTYGPWAVFALLLLPIFAEDMIIVPAGVLLAHVEDHFVRAMFAYAIAAYAGVLINDFIWYFIGYRYGTPVLHKRWFKRLAHPRRLLQAKHQMEKKGAWMIVVARFIPASRTTAITMAGMLHMPFWKFFLAEVFCVLFTVPLQLSVGYLIGRGFGGKDTVDLVWSLIGVMTIVAVLMFLVGQWRKSRQSEARPPRAKARWLRRFRVPLIRREDEKPTKV